jgi:hypothetical protein
MTGDIRCAGEATLGRRCTRDGSNSDEAIVVQVFGIGPADTRPRIRSSRFGLNSAREGGGAPRWLLRRVCR